MGGKSHRARTAGVRTVGFPISDSHEEHRKMEMVISVYPMIVASCPLGPPSAKRSESIKDGEKLNSLCTAGGAVKWCNCIGKGLSVPPNGKQSCRMTHQFHCLLCTREK